MERFRDREFENKELEVISPGSQLSWLGSKGYRIILTSELNRISNANTDEVVAKRISVDVKLSEER